MFGTSASGTAHARMRRNKEAKKKTKRRRLIFVVGKKKQCHGDKTEASRSIKAQGNLAAERGMQQPLGVI